jgi:hypothetical protein
MSIVSSDGDACNAAICIYILIGSSNTIIYIDTPYTIDLLHVSAFHHQVLTQFTFTLSSSTVLPYIGQCFYLGIIFLLLNTNVMSCVVCSLKLIYKILKILNIGTKMSDWASHIFSCVWYYGC